VFTALGVVLAIAAGVLVVAVVTASPSIRTRSQFVAGTPEPGQGAVELDTSLYLPQHTPAPAVLLAHGFGGDKNDLAGQARSLARHGYVVLAYTARGFGRSGGLIHLDAPAYEVADARKLITYLAAQPEVQKDGANDPRVAVAGSSYGGALALLTAGYDHRVDAVAADITWNKLTSALFPNAASAAGSVTATGVFKRLWAAYLFGNGAAAGSGASGASGSGSSGQSGSRGPSGSGSSGAVGASACGRFAAALCSAYQNLAQGKLPDPSILTLLDQSSPAGVLSRIDAPTLLTQGEQDSLFPLSEADANARGIAAHGTPVSVQWRLGGHDTGSGTDAAESAALAWFDHVLKHRAAPKNGFALTLAGGGISVSNGRPVSQVLTAKTGYPGAGGAAQHTSVTVRGTAQQVSAPAGGSPAGISSLPGLSSLLSAASGTSLFTSLTNLPGQFASFTSAPLTTRLRITGASTVTLDVTPRTSTDATLFVSLQDVGPDGSTTLPAQLVAPVSLVGLRAGQAQRIQVQLPSVVHDIDARHQIRLTVSTTDQGYALPTDPRTYTIALAGGSALVSVPTVATVSSPDRAPLIWLLVGLLAVALAVAAATTMSRRAMRGPVAAADAVPLEDAHVPVIVTDLVKEYGDGFRAVDGVSFRVERGQIVGLLGPNGAGKTTALRVFMGLIHPTAGSVRIFGAPVVPGAAVLSRVGAFVEGPGLLPHLSGRDNLRLSWAASGRPAHESQLETALEIAGLGSSVDRRVKTYSQGMRQRLAIAQAMLGLPELLILDEPTNGLDPPQIAEMRLVLRSYAETGRTVVISSHLLAEVEQTCTHVVVMHRGRLIAAGSVDEIAGSDEVTLAVDDPARAEAVLVAAGIAVSTVPSRRGLEEVFLDLVGED
jgi:ABC-2 type transport system ATP-binding protein